MGSRRYPRRTRANVIHRVQMRNPGSTVPRTWRASARLPNPMPRMRLGPIHPSPSSMCMGVWINPPRPSPSSAPFPFPGPFTMNHPSTAHSRGRGEHCNSVQLTAEQDDPSCNFFFFFLTRQGGASPLQASPPPLSPFSRGLGLWSVIRRRADDGLGGWASSIHPYTCMTWMRGSGLTR